MLNPDIPCQVLYCASEMQQFLDALEIFATQTPWSPSRTLADFYSTKLLAGWERPGLNSKHMPIVTIRWFYRPQGHLHDPFHFFYETILYIYTCIALHCIALHFVLHCIALHYITLQYIHTYTHTHVKSKLCFCTHFWTSNRAVGSHDFCIETWFDAMTASRVFKSYIVKTKVHTTIWNNNCCPRSLKQLPSLKHRFNVWFKRICRPELPVSTSWFQEITLRFRVSWSDICFFSYSSYSITLMWNMVKVCQSVVCVIFMRRKKHAALALRPSWAVCWWVWGSA